jgi:hypothetical protein
VFDRIEVRRAGLRKAAERSLEAFFVTPDMLHPEWKMLLSIDGLQEAGPRQPDQAPIMRTTICRWRQMSAWRSTNVAVVVTLRSQIEILEKRLQGRVKSNTAS